MTLPPNYARIFEALPLYLVDKAYVGGGYAVDHTKARDIDLWLLDTTVSESLLDDLMFDAPAGFTPEIIIGQSGNYDIVPGVHVSKTALYRSELFDKPIQLCVTPDLVTIPEALATFDLSVHQWAFDSKGNRYGAPTATLPGEPIRILRDTTPEWTFKRYVRLTLRYGQQLDVQEMAKLGLTEARQGELFREVYSVPEGVAA